MKRRQRLGGGHQDEGGRRRLVARAALAVAARKTVKIVGLSEVVNILIYRTRKPKWKAVQGGRRWTEFKHHLFKSMLINAVKNVTSALGTLMQVTKLASGKNMHHLAIKLKLRP